MEGNENLGMGLAEIPTSKSEMGGIAGESKRRIAEEGRGRSGGGGVGGWDGWRG